MLKYLKLENVGPAAEMELDLAPRLNILTGDNGLGKSFLLDVAWFVMTGCWPAEVNPKLVTGSIAIPNGNGIAEISFLENHKQTFFFNTSHRFWDFDHRTLPKNFPSGLVIYLMADGSASIFDPLRNERIRNQALKPSALSKAFSFNSSQVWNGATSEDNKPICNGLIRDWTGWQNKGGEIFKFFTHLLKILSPSETDLIVPGELTRISLEDVRDMPTIEMAYGNQVPIVHASSGIRKILSFAYLFVWAWEEHKQAAKLTQKPTTDTIYILIDELDAHLHPQWQRKIVSSILAVKSVLPDNVDFQILASTHSPLIMASLEPVFDKKKDAWFDLDLVGQNGHREVVLTKRDFIKQGDVGNWLTSEAFDLDSTVSLEAEKVLKEAEEALVQSGFNYEQAKLLHQKLTAVLPADDDFFLRWKIVGNKKGWWKND